MLIGNAKIYRMSKNEIIIISVVTLIPLITKSSEMSCKIVLLTKAGFRPA